jgi:hypothetical protein
MDFGRPDVVFGLLVYGHPSSDVVFGLLVYGHPSSDAVFGLLVYGQPKKDMVYGHPDANQIVFGHPDTKTTLLFKALPAMIRLLLRVCVPRIRSS